MSGHRNCDACDRMTFDPKPCVTCFKTDRNSALCSDHRHQCASCSESMCPDHSVVVKSAEHAPSEVRCLQCAESAAIWTNTLPAVAESTPPRHLTFAQLNRRLAEVAAEHGIDFTPRAPGRAMELSPRYRGKFS